MSTTLLGYHLGKRIYEDSTTQVQHSPPVTGSSIWSPLNRIRRVTANRDTPEKNGCKEAW